MLKSLRELYDYRELVRHLVSLDLKIRYRGTIFGFLWTLLNPLLLMLVLSAVFSKLGRIDEKHYALFLLSGLMVWTFFTQTINNSLNSVVKQKSLLQKIYLPKLVFPVAMCLSNLINLGFFFTAYLFIAIWTPVGLTSTLPMIVPAILMLSILSLGCALVMATLNVFFRDFSHLTSIVLRALFYLTPIIYPPSLLGPTAEKLLKFNPVYYPVVITREAIYYGVHSDPAAWGYGFLGASIVLLVGLKVFTHHQDRFIYYA